MFLAILTLRCQEWDFENYLPVKLILSLTSLLMSIGTSYTCGGFSIAWSFDHLLADAKSYFKMKVERMHTFGYFLAFAVPSALVVMNMMWFGKILKGLKEALAKKLQTGSKRKLVLI